MFFHKKGGLLWRGLRLGISSFTYPFLSGVNPAQRPAQPLTPLGLIDKAVSLDVGCVQYSHNLPFDDFSDATLDEIRVYAQERGILLETGMKGMTPARLERYIDISARLGVSMLRGITDAAGYEPPMEETVRVVHRASCPSRAARPDARH